MCLIFQRKKQRFAEAVGLDQVYMVRSSNAGIWAQGSASQKPTLCLLCCGASKTVSPVLLDPDGHLLSTLRVSC